MGSTGKTDPAQRSRCPTCGKPAAPRGQPGFPFCSQRCQLADLGRWLDEDYRVPDRSLDADDEIAEADEDE
jgi:uncharacterized protein